GEETSTDLHRHEKIHNGLKPFVCIFCSKSFRQKCQLVAHRRMHHGEEKPYTCERCGFKFSSTLTYHKRRHTGEKPYQCDLCGMSFSVSSSLIAHARKHTGERVFPLLISPAETYSCVPGETPYKCSQPQCSSSFVTSSELKKHMRRLHPGEFSWSSIGRETERKFGHHF
uniref:C2H2-type domain-containing protein n=1 Tax=Mola mola TaxID=94237 RepID=A0A3Q3WS66_MOLML